MLISVSVSRYFLPLLFFLGACGQPNPESPDWILHNGKVVTVDGDFRIVEAVSIRANEFHRVGSNSELLDTRGPSTRVVDLGGRTVIPGLIDNHNHLQDKAVDQYLGVEVALVESLEEMLDAIHAKAEDTPPGEMIYTTSGWLMDQLAEKTPPDRFSLDGAAPDHPVLVQGGHTYYLNSAALELAGINRATPSPSGGLVHKDPGGVPTGLLVDNAMALARHLIPKPTHEDRMEALRVAQRKQNAVGVTGIREPGLTPEKMRAYNELRAREGLTLRVSMNLSLDNRRSAEELIQQLEEWGVGTGFGDPWLRLDGIGEFGIDGGFEAALMSEPYHELAGAPAPADYYGLQRIETRKFEEVMVGMARLNWRGSVHVVGDRGLDVVLAAYEKANQAKDIGPLRWILEHCHYTRPDQFEKIKELGLSISTQFHPYMSSNTMIRHWGLERAAQTMRLRNWLDAGIRVGGGSDWSLVPANPFWMIYFWVTRETRLWDVIGPEQRISREEALRVMSINNAYLTFEEDIKGSIEPGKLADFVILSEDILTVPEEKIRDIRALATFVEGKLVYEAPDAESLGLK